MRKLILSIAALSMSLIAFSQAQFSGMAWSLQNHDVRSQAMGGTSSLANQFGMAGLGNPASIVFSEFTLVDQRVNLRGEYAGVDREKTFTFGASGGWQFYRPQATHFAYASASARIGIVGISAAYIAGFGASDDPYWKALNYVGRDRQINLGVAVRIFPIFSVGGSVKFITENYDVSGSRRKLFSGDLFAMLDWNGFRATAGVRNLSGSYRAGATDYRMPYSYVVGAGYKLDVLTDVFCFEVDAEYEAFRSGASLLSRAGFGASLRFLGFLAVRGGYNWGGASPVPTYASIGLGAGIARIIELEACYLFNRDGRSQDLMGFQLNVKF